MTTSDVQEIRTRVREKRPLIHCITNPISITQCANTVLSAGARPIMAEHPLEAAEITETASALMLNIANITDARMRSIRISAETAKNKGIPFILDVVGISCSTLRRSYAGSLISELVPTVIKGNYSEICALYDSGYKSSGVDAHSSATFERTIDAAVNTAGKYGNVILASGKRDIVTDGKRLLFADNGTPRLGEITGTGCMQGALAAAYLSCGDGYSAAAAACTVMGICGQLAEKYKGMGSFSAALFDALSLIDEGDIREYMKVEEKDIEAI